MGVHKNTEGFEKQLKIIKTKIIKTIVIFVSMR